MYVEYAHFSQDEQEPIRFEWLSAQKSYVIGRKSNSPCCQAPRSGGNEPNENRNGKMFLLMKKNKKKQREKNWKKKTKISHNLSYQPSIMFLSAEKFELLQISYENIYGGCWGKRAIFHDVNVIDVFAASKN